MRRRPMPTSGMPNWRARPDSTPSWASISSGAKKDPLTHYGRTKSGTYHHAPGLLAHGHRLEYALGRYIDHGDVVADAVGRVQPALVGIEGEVPDALTH